MAKSKKKRPGLKTNVDEDPGPDISLLSRPTATSVKGIRDVLKAYEEGTDEVHHLLSNECELLYECRVCRSMYRSFLNFITHKRIYCQQQYTSGNAKVSHFFNDALDEDETVVVLDETMRATRQTSKSVNAQLDVNTAALNIPTATKPKPVPRKNLTEILGLLSQKANNNTDGLKRIINLDGYTDMTATSSNDPSSAGFKGRMPRQHLLQLESIESTDVALKQTVTLGPDGKILEPNTAIVNENEEQAASPQPDDNQNDNDLVCTKCSPHATFSTRKTYRHHMNSQHDPTRISFVCPCCKRHFANSWSVHRHLKTIHGKSTDQLRKLRDQIQTVKREVTSDDPNKSNFSSKLTRQLVKVEDLAKEKLERDCSKKTELELFERELNVCSGCNKKFERFASFKYHIKTCQKRHTILNSTNARKVTLALKSSSSTKIVSPTKITVDDEKLEVLDTVSDSDSTVDPEVDVASAPSPMAGYESREARASVRPEPAVAKKIEIQLRRDYNKIVVPVISDVQSVIIPDDGITNNEDSAKCRIDIVTNSESPSHPICVTTSDFADFFTKQKSMVNEDADKDGHDVDKESNPSYASSNSDASDSCESETENKVEDHIDDEASDSNSQPLETKPSHIFTVEQSDTEADDTATNDTATVDISMSPEPDVVKDALITDQDALADLNEKHSTLTEDSETSNSSLQQKSILEGILMKEVESMLPVSPPSSSNLLDISLHADDVSTYQCKKPLKKRPSVTDCNGIVENTSYHVEPKKKRFKGVQKLLPTSGTILPHNGNISEDGTTSNYFRVKVGDADMTDIEEMMEPRVDVTTETETVEDGPSVLQLCDADVHSTPYEDENAPSEVDDSDYRIDDNSPTSVQNNKADVDADILKVIFEEEDISQTSSVRYKKGTIIMENGTFSLHANVPVRTEPINVSPCRSPRDCGVYLSKELQNSSTAKEECTRSADSIQARNASEQSSSAPEEDHQTSFDSESETPSRSSSLPSVEQMRSSSAIDSDGRSSTPVISEPRSISAMEVDRKVMNSERENQFSGETEQDNVQRQSSDFESETLTSSNESLLSRSRPIRNKAKAKNSDFIYDLSDKAVYEDDRSPVKSKPVSKVYQKHQTMGVAPVQLKDGVPSMNPQVTLVRTDDISRLNLGSLKAVKPLSTSPGSAKNTFPSLNTTTTTRKSVRAVTKL